MEGMDIKVMEEVERLSKIEGDVVEVDGRKYWKKTQEAVFHDPRPSPVVLPSLLGLTEYLNRNLENIEVGMIIANSPREVVVLEPFAGESKARTCYARAAARGQPFRFGNWMDVEEFIIGLMTQFDETEDRPVIIAVASGLVSEAKIAKIDSGATSKLQVNHGVINQSGIPDKDIPVIVKLRPHRTFREVEQPEGIYLFRYQASGDGIVCKLIEADGGAWEYKAQENIKAFLLKNLGSDVKEKLSIIA